MSVERSVAQLLQQIARQDVVQIGPENSAGRAAALVHIAEQYGFEYGETRRTGHKDAQVLVLMYRDPRPEARAREAATLAAHPQAGNGGPVPGMRPGSLKPLPEAEAAVAQGTDRIRFDALAEAGGKKKQLLAFGYCAVLPLVLLIAGMPLGALFGGAALAAFVFGGFKIGAVRRQRIAQRLTEAGFAQVRDEQGRTRFLRPGQQLPGHANPFAV
ncbi:hypothetical protein ACFXD5_41590 [Streptomyces sp. NPDC059385]|uniref:hypothetical protein n=1 Tax=Streptomyces sp. NPDC059385 TaxID=3346817 RepID=UPI00368DEB73